MKITKLLLTLPFLVGLISCSGNKDPKENIINSLLNGVNVKVDGIETITYPAVYSYLNSSTKIEIDRDYKYIKEEDGSLTPTVRENTGMEFSTYLRNNDGLAVSEYYTSKNEIYEEILKISGNKILFNERFANPFEYVDVDDISDDYSLDLAKATYIVESYTGLQYAVTEAKFVVENNVATSLNVTISDRVDLIPESETSDMPVTCSLELSIDFTYGINEIVHLKPRSEADDSLKGAFNNLSSYTLLTNIEGETTPTQLFVTGDDVFYHYGTSVGLNDGDRYYKSIGNGYYDEYTYSFASGLFNMTDFDIKKESFLPLYEEFSPNILLKSSEDVYEFDASAAKYGMEALFIPEYNVTGGIGISGSLTLKDGNIDTITGRFYPNVPFTVTHKFSNHGNTSMPEWLDLSLIK